MINEIDEIKEIAERNYNLIAENTKKINNNLERINQNSYALEILKDYKKENKRMFIILIIVLCMWFLTIGYLVYVLNDVGTIQTTQEISDVESIGGNVVNNGDMYGENKTND